ncbi:AsmA family protein [Microbulbifer sp. 2201CG32-9]|uniref:AsmA family protein n=1 Tax=Microbulbifer sp. 2201CG32-9 TaxID=3232309 RepID=UPI00345B8E94
MAWIKRTATALLIVLLLLAGAVAWLLAGIDVNRYKPQFEQLAAKHGIALALDGDIGWQLWPDLALQLDGVQLAPLAQPDQPLVKADRIAVGVALMPLLKKRIEAQEILLQKPQIQLTVDKNGRGNWQQLTQAVEEQQSRAAEEPPKLQVPAGKSGPGDRQLQLALDKLRIEDGRVSYSDAGSETQYTVEKLRLTADNLVPGGEPGQVSANALVSGSALQQAVTLELNGTLALDEGIRGLRLQPLQLSVSSGPAAALVSLRGHLRRNGPDAPWRMQLNLKAEAEPLRPWLDIMGTGLSVRSDTALQKFSLETSIEGTGRKLELTPLQLQLDETQFTGSAQLRNADMPGLDLTLRGGALIVDNYLPPPPAEASAEPAEAPVEPAPAAAEPEPVPLPLTAMRGFNANIDLGMEQLRAFDIQLDRPQLQLTIDNGLYRLQKLSAGLYGGELNTNGTFNARAQSAETSVSGGLTGVELARLQQALFPSERVKLSGSASVNWTAQTHGADTAQLQEQLRAAIQVSSDQLALAPFNLERGMCQLVSLVEKSPLPQREWPAQTRLQDLRANIAVDGTQVQVREIQGGIENIAMSGDGSLDLQKSEFDFALGLALAGQKTSADGCSVQNDRWRNRPLPLRCKGNFDDAGIGSCKPDSRRLDDLVREELKYKAEKKYGRKVQEKVDELKDRLKGLFRRD